MHDSMWLHWFMIGFFALFGWWVLSRRGCFANAGSYFCLMNLEEPAQARLVSAYRRRERSEALPSTWMAGTLGVLSLVLALLAALTPVPLVLLYAGLTVGLASTLALGYSRLRASAIRRVATLRVRDANTIAPPYVWALVAISVVLPLLWLPVAPLASLLVTAAGVAIAILARRVAAMPALLDGEDVVVETFVDTRLRAARALNLLGTAVAPGFFCASLTGYTDSIAHAAAFAFALLALAVITSRQVMLVRRSPAHAEVSMWFHAAP